MTTYTCSTATCRKAVASLQVEAKAWDRFKVEPAEISKNIKILSYKKRETEWSRTRKQERKGSNQLTMPPCLCRKMLFNGVKIDTCELESGRVIIFDEHLNGREYNNWLEAYRSLVWHYAMQSQAIPLSLSGHAGKPSWTDNHFSGDSKWT